MTQPIIYLQRGSTFKDMNGYVRMAGVLEGDGEAWISAPLSKSVVGTWDWETHVGNRVVLRSPCPATMREVLERLAPELTREDSQGVGMPIDEKDVIATLSYWETFRNDEDKLYILYRRDDGIGLARTDVVEDFDPAGKWAKTKEGIYALQTPIHPQNRAQEVVPLKLSFHAVGMIQVSPTPFKPILNSYRTLPKFGEFMEAMPLFLATGTPAEAVYSLLTNAPSQAGGEVDMSNVWEDIELPETPWFKRDMNSSSSWVFNSDLGLFPCTRSGKNLKYYITLDGVGWREKAEMIVGGLPRLVEALSEMSGTHEIQFKFPKSRGLLQYGLDNIVIHYTNPAHLLGIQEALEYADFRQVDRASFGRDSLGLDTRELSDGHAVARHVATALNALHEVGEEEFLHTLAQIHAERAEYVAKAHEWMEPRPLDPERTF
jgi:hypothetical protein